MHVIAQKGDFSHILDYKSNPVPISLLDDLGIASSMQLITYEINCCTYKEILTLRQTNTKVIHYPKGYMYWNSYSLGASAIIHVHSACEG